MVAEANCVIYALHLGDHDYRYVGLTRCGASLRLRKHRNLAAQTQRHIDIPVYRWMRKNGADRVRIEVLEVVATPEELDAREIFWIAKLKADGYVLLNCTAGGGGMRVVSEEVRAKLAYWKGRSFSNEHLAKLSGVNASFYGRKHTAETRAKMSANNGAKRPEVAAKIRAAKLGVPRSEETIRRIRETKAASGTNPCNHLRWHVERDQWADNCEFCLFEVS